MILESESEEFSADDIRELCRRLEAQLETQNAVIAEMEAHAEERQRVIEELSAANRMLHEACEERLNLIEQQNGTILELQGDLQTAAAFPGLAQQQRERERALEELSAANGHLQAICDERAALLESQLQTIAMLQEECAQRDGEIARLHRTAVERLSVIEALNKALERLPG
jgi:hypothetical protein